ncbi:MAG: ABC transporter substrate-binding protein [Alcaligenaceae bacterium]|nr:ABC transporter substrate-binding protein [Alcaligenaceae bacterium]
MNRNKGKTHFAMLVGMACMAGMAAGSANAAGDSAQSTEGGFKCDKVSIGYQVIPNSGPIVRHFGWMKKALPGVDVQFHEFNQGADLARAMASGDVDFGLSGSVGVASGISTGVDNVVVWLFDVIGKSEALVVKKDAGINSLEDLVGKRVGTPFGATTQYALVSALKVHNIDPNSVQIMDIQNPDAVAAWSRGELVADYTWQPTQSKLIEMGGKVLVNSEQLAQKYGIATADVGMARREYADTCPKIVTAWVQQQIRAVKFYRDKPKEAAEAVAAEFSLPADEIADQMSQYIWLDGKQQLSQKWLGAPDKKGHMAEVLASTAQFLQDQQLISKAASQEEFAKRIRSEFVQMAVDSAK